MDKRKVSIMVSSKLGAGKTTIAMMIRNYLRSVGITADIVGDSTADYYDKKGVVIMTVDLQPMTVFIETVEEVKDGDQGRS